MSAVRTCVSACELENHATTAAGDDCPACGMPLVTPDCPPWCDGHDDATAVDPYEHVHVLADRPGVLLALTLTGAATAPQDGPYVAVHVTARADDAGGLETLAQTLRDAAERVEHQW